MGRKRNRKQRRRVERRQDSIFGESLLTPPVLSDDDILALVGARDAAPAENRAVCGGCMEFVPDELASRGECLHPGSGFVSPWEDTPACDFFRARRRSPRASWNAPYDRT